jgi:hypothetical protein
MSYQSVARDDEEHSRMLAQANIWIIDMLRAAANNSPLYRLAAVEKLSISSRPRQRGLPFDTP